MLANDGIMCEVGTYLLLRIGDLAYRGVLTKTFDGCVAGNSILLEFALFTIPYFMFKQQSVRKSGSKLFLCSLSVICAVVLNRFDVFLIRVDMGENWNYFSSVGEFAVTFAFMALAVMMYKIGINYLPIMEKEHLHETTSAQRNKKRAPFIGSPLFHLTLYGSSSLKGNRESRFKTSIRDLNI